MGARSDVDVERLLADARNLGAQILSQRAEIERERRLPLALVEPMREAGMFELWLPRVYGGPELHPIDFVRVVEILARADGSVGWCAAVCSVGALIAGSLLAETAREVFRGHNIVAGTVNPTGKAVAVDGGYRVTGQWAYGSGIDHAAWVVGNCIVHDGDAPRRKPSGAPEMRFILFPRREVEVMDNWRVGGLRGTGSHDFRIHDVFAPEARGAPAFANAGLLPGALYQTPMISLFAVSLAAVTLGIARAAIDALVELAIAKTPMGSAVPLRDKPITQMQLARAEALVRAARAFLFEAIREQWDEIESGQPPSMEKRAAIRIACTHAGECCAAAVDLVHNTAGGSAIQESGRIERCFRDVHAATQHIGLATSNYELAGRALLGLDVGTPRF
jgi:alkylation response protein AidB-like acyl-CoA dehydrogenase